jgi:putative membrane protein
VKSVSTDLAASRTALAFQRTRMSAEGTLMSVIRTALSLIGFGFTIFQFFRKLKDAGTLTHDASPRNFGLFLVFLGVGLLVVGIVYHLQFMRGLRVQWQELTASGLAIGDQRFPISFTLVSAVLLLLLGLTAIISMTFNIGPLS